MFNARGLANTAWAFATASQWDEKLFALLARAAEWQGSEFNAQGLVNTAWALAAMGQSDQKLFAALATAAEPRVSESNP